MGQEAIALGHIGLMLGLMGLMLMVLILYSALAPYPDTWAAFTFPMIPWALGVLFVVGEWFEYKREA